MIKLINLLEATYTDTFELQDDDLINKGFKLGEPEIDPKTGASTNTVVYLPKFEQIRKDILNMRKEFQPFKFSRNEDIAGLAKDINTNLTKLSQMVFAIDKMIELQKKSK
jgi:hypothetical protein